MGAAHGEWRQQVGRGPWNWLSQLPQKLAPNLVHSTNPMSHWTSQPVCTPKQEELPQAAGAHRSI